MEYFVLLTAATALIAILAIALYRRQRDLSVLLATSALYYWSLYGAWFVVIDKLGGFSGKNYYYLESKMFPVALDGHYMISLVLYAGFIVAAQLTVLVTLTRGKQRQVPPLMLRHGPLLAASFLAGLASLLIIRDKLSLAWALNASAYYVTRFQYDQWFTLHQVLNRAALIPASIGLATLLAGDRSRNFVSRGGRYFLGGYLALIAGMGAFTLILGNKNEMFVALLTGVLAYLSAVHRPNLFKVAAVVVAGMWFLYAVDFFRGVALSDMQRAVTEHFEDANDLGAFLTSSNESYAAHFSMYGVLAANVEPQFGYSLYALICSVVPRVWWPDRPLDIYYYYSESVGAIQGQGYSLHHATAWYLNFGYAGVLLGGVVLGCVWSFCLRARDRIRPNSGLLARIFAAIAPWVFTAYLPPLIRAGPEIYKGFVLEGILIPLAVLALACRIRKPDWRATLDIRTTDRQHPVRRSTRGDDDLIHAEGVVERSRPTVLERGVRSVWRP